MPLIKHKSVSVSDHAAQKRQAAAKACKRKTVKRKTSEWCAPAASSTPPSKDDLLRSQFTRIVAPMLALKPEEACPLDATAFFAHVLSSSRIYKALIGGAEAGAAPTVLRDCFEERVLQALHQGKNSAALPSESALRQAIISRVVASSMLAVIECGMESNPTPSPREAQAILRKFVGGGLTALRTSDSGSPADR